MTEHDVLDKISAWYSISHRSAVSSRRIWRPAPTERCEVKIFQTRDTIMNCKLYHINSGNSVLRFIFSAVILPF